MAGHTPSDQERLNAAFELNRRFSGGARVPIKAEGIENLPDVRQQFESFGLIFDPSTRLIEVDPTFTFAEPTPTPTTEQPVVDEAPVTTEQPAPEVVAPTEPTPTDEGVAQAPVEEGAEITPTGEQPVAEEFFFTASQSIQGSPEEIEAFSNEIKLAVRNSLNQEGVIQTRPEEEFVAQKFGIVWDTQKQQWIDDPEGGLVKVDIVTDAERLAMSQSLNQPGVIREELKPQLAEMFGLEFDPQKGDWVADPEYDPQSALVFFGRPGQIDLIPPEIEQDLTNIFTERIEQIRTGEFRAFSTDDIMGALKEEITLFNQQSAVTTSPQAQEKLLERQRAEVLFKEAVERPKAMQKVVGRALTVAQQVDPRFKAFMERELVKRGGVARLEELNREMERLREEADISAESDILQSLGVAAGIGLQSLFPEEDLKFRTS